MCWSLDFFEEYSFLHYSSSKGFKNICSQKVHAQGIQLEPQILLLVLILIICIHNIGT